MKAILVSTYRLTDKEDVVYIHNEILFNHKKEEIVLYAETWMDVENDKYHMISLTWESKYRYSVSVPQSCPTLCNPIDCI